MHVIATHRTPALFAAFAVALVFALAGLALDAVTTSNAKVAKINRYPYAITIFLKKTGMLCHTYIDL